MDTLSVLSEIEVAIDDLTALRATLQANPALAADVDFLESVENATHTLSHATELV